MPPSNPKRKSSGAQAPKLSPQQQQKRVVLFKKLNQAIDDGFASQALTKLNQLKKNFPRDLDVYMTMGRANSALGRHPEAIESYRIAAELSPDNPDIRYYYGAALQRGGEVNEALLEFERVLYKKPDHFYALRQKTSALADMAREEDAYKAYLQLEDVSRGMNLDKNKLLAIAISGARFAPKHITPGEAIANMEAHIEEATDIAFKRAAYFQLGRLYHSIKEHDNSFDSYIKGKEVDPYEWNPDLHSERIDQLIDCWRTDEPIPYANAKGVDGSRLIFIVGMMRSGTSLTEQMLAQVKGVVPGGEMNAVSREIPKEEVNKLKYTQRYPLDRSLYTLPRLNKMARRAMQGFNEVHPEYAVTDKQPFNYAFVPLIAHMFPGCKIIHCVRDELDCCLSNFTQAFARPHPQTQKLHWLGRYFADYERTMKAWHDIPEVDMIDLVYEELVEDPEGQSKRVLEFLGREWTEDILEFHKSKRIVNTASRDQVRKEIYTSSVKKYTPYEHRLDDLKAGIAEGRARPHGG